MRLFEEAYEDLGDSQAIQIQTYRKVAPMKNHGRDIYTSTLRYYRNAFTDADKQMAINVFLGVFVPKEGEANMKNPLLQQYLSFDEIYKTNELTDFDRLLSTSVVRTGDNVVSLDSEGGAIQGNPFVVRDKMKMKLG
ncbi:PREDICTED: polyphosphoinositide phosphatase-like isoform X3 [Amphimedon queenslandica]|nr:PREDICTED: polyphosphoinositide phosphatase-like isoform X3 [Amphimedon queenslandica]|eukprot:XP_019855238.1 PREDICTED: polyphosphoinositide phosphatase-like isoform X3 [Amphimedon queenslandica]